MAPEIRPMPSTDATATADRREFPAQFGWGLLALGCAVITVILFLASKTVDAGLSCLRAWGPLPPLSPWRMAPLFAAAAVDLVVAGLMAALAVACAQEDTRAGAVVAADAIEVINRRGRRTVIPWGDVQELWLVGWAGPHGVPRTRLKTPTKVVKIPDLIREREPLMAEFIARAGLTEVQRGRFRLTYRRGQGPAPQEESA
jgi:hypothetical protein